ncbi:GNAT family N-acetyltransferase [Agromyces mediolanus]|uniref:GNAT family N-acetyltransferase n=1 Tax=Agromyces mediolanus TaxID=41986 RepID=UPI003835C0A0
MSADAPRSAADAGLRSAVTPVAVVAVAAAPDDPAILAIATSVLRERLPGIPPELAAPLIAGQVAAKFASLRAERPAATAVLLHVDAFGPDAVGYLVVDRSGEDLRLADLAVLASVRGRGVAGAALAALSAEADASGRAITLSVWAGDAAERLYLRHGFERAGFEHAGLDRIGTDADARAEATGYVELRRAPRSTARQASVWSGDTSSSRNSAQ